MGDLNICPEGENVLSTPPCPPLPVPVLQPVLGDGLPQGDWGTGKQWPTGLAPLEGLVSLGLILSLAKFLP